MAQNPKKFEVPITVNGNITTTGDANVAGKLNVTASSGDEGGEIFLSKAVTNTTIVNGVTIDVYQDKLRFFEQGGSARGYYIDIPSGGAGVGTSLVGGGSSSNSFTTISTPSGTSPVADSTTDTLTLTAGTGISITGDATADSIAIATNGASANGASTLVLRDSNGSFSANVVTASTFSGSGASLTNIPGANVTGTLTSTVLGNSTAYVGTTAIALNRASANQGLTGISSVTLPGSTSGTIQLLASAVAGTGTVVTLPATTGTVVTTGDSGTVSNGMLANSAITIDGTSTALGGSISTNNYYPSAIVFNAGTSAGPTLDLTMSGTGAPNLTAVAIPSASDTASGVVTTGTQTFAGSKTFSASLAIITGGNTGLTIGRTDGTSSTGYIDFNTGATVVDYDARIAVTGGTGTTGQANIAFTSSGITSNSGITAPTFTSNVATGTAPFTVSSTTMVTNLNADLLEGYSPATANGASTIVLRDASGNFAANVITANIAIANVTGLGTNVATFLQTPSSANLRNAVTDETGTGALVFRGSTSAATSDIAIGWYTIAYGSNTRAGARFRIVDGRSGVHQQVVFHASNNFHLDTAAGITVLHQSAYTLASAPVQKIRIKNGNVSTDGFVLQVYIDSASNSLTAYMYDNESTASWTLPTNWVDDATDPGVTAYANAAAVVEVNLDSGSAGKNQILVTGDIYAGTNAASKVYTTADASTANTASTLVLKDASGNFAANAITATSFNKMAITAPATGSTLAVANLKTFTVSNTITLTGTDSTSFAFPSTSSTVMTLAQPGTLTGSLTLRAGAATASNAPLYFGTTTPALLTSAANAAVEYDGYVFYGTPAVPNAGSTGRGVLQTSMTYVINNNTTIATGSTAGTISANMMNGKSVYLAANTTYQVEVAGIVYSTWTVNAASGFGANLAFSGVTSAQTITMSYVSGTSATATAAQQQIILTSTTGQQITASPATTQYIRFTMLGTIRTGNAATTFSPVFYLTSGASPATSSIVVQGGSYIKVTPLGNTGADINVGGWA